MPALPFPSLCQVVADGYLVEGHGLVIDEASLTGEADPVKKTAEKDPWCRSGTQVRVTEGPGGGGLGTEAAVHHDLGG